MMVFVRTLGNLTKTFSKSQIPGGSSAGPRGGMIAVGIDWSILSLSLYACSAVLTSTQDFLCLCLCEA
jgi:hypothetical protein